MHPSEFAAEFGIPVSLALVTMLTQLIGSILLILGALTPPAAFGIAGTMIPATIFLIRRGEPFINPAGHSWEKRGFLSNGRSLPGSKRRRALVIGCTDSSVGHNSPVASRVVASQRR